MGRAIFEAAKATKERVGRNTNLGIILLLAPLAAVPNDVPLADGIGAILAGLEHLDDRYLKAVGYATKSKRGAAGNGSGLPKMVLVGDIVGDDADAVARATSEVVRIANSRSGEGFVAVSADARKKFWLDRKRTALYCLTGPVARCYAGVGVVRDSDPPGELAETEIKLQALLPVLS